MTLRVLVCEYITGGGLAGRPLPPSLAREGDLMLSALIHDLSMVPGVECTATRDRRLDMPPLDARFVIPAQDENAFDLWGYLATEVDAVWPIAPETDGCLERLSVLVLDKNRTLLGSRPEAVRLAGSKQATSTVLARHGVPVVETVPAGAALPPSRFGWVAKPDDGVGAEDTLFFTEPAALGEFLAAQDRADRFVVQPCLPGVAASLSVLFRDGESSLLSCNRQDVTATRGRLRYRGGVVGALEEFRPMLAPIAEAVAAALPGLWGYAGIDLVLTPDGPAVLEVNPRLTTSYAGLGRALEANPAGFVVDLAGGGKLAAAAPVRAVPVELGANVG
jgi:predicted ATP-grasp superfamily ATP-dependent carboligase